VNEPLDERTRPRLRDDIAFVPVADETVVWDPERERVHRLDRVASAIAPYFDGNVSLGELAIDVAHAWSFPRGEAFEALVGLAKGLRDAGLLVDSPSDTDLFWPVKRPGYLVNPPAP
jgi:hypothetical protein